MPPIAAGPSAAQVKDVKVPVGSLGAWGQVVELLLWLAFILFHAVAVAFFGFTAHCYRILPHSGLDRWLSFFALGMGTESYGRIALVHAVVAAIHAGFILQMVVLTIKKRRLAFSGDSLHRHRQATGVRATARVFHLLQRGLFGIYAALFTRDGLLGIYGPCFELILLAREVVETLLQTIQAYRMSRFLSRVELNRFYVALLVLNCWSTVFVHQIFHGDHVKRYLAALSCDFLLDWVSAIVVPAMLVYLYSKDFDGSTDDFFGLKWFEDVWLTTAMSEFQVILVVSWADLAARMVFALGMISNMQAVKRLVGVTLPSIRQEPASRSLHAIAPAPSDSAASSVKPPSSSPSWLVRANLLVKTNAALSRLLRLIFFAWGAIVLALHLHAELNPSLPQCKMQARPWGISTPSCPLVVLDCHQERLTGSRDGMLAMLEPLHHPSVKVLFVRHCPHFEMPEVVTKMRGLECLKMYNSTIASWTSEAAFTKQQHPDLMSVLLLRVNTIDGKIPLGLQFVDPPPTLRSIGFVASNIRELPDDLHLKWPPYGTIQLDSTQLTEVPDVLAKLRPKILILANSPISHLPEALFEVDGMEVLHLEGTLITALPDQVISRRQHSAPSSSRARTSRSSRNGSTSGLIEDSSPHSWRRYQQPTRHTASSATK